MNTFRVDRAQDLAVPCGMNSIQYLGDSEKQARVVFSKTGEGVDTWGKRHKGFGVLLSKWDPKKNDYIVLAHKGI